MSHSSPSRVRRAVAALAAGVAASLVATGATPAVAAPIPSLVRGPITGPFHTYTGSTPLEEIPLGTVLARRTIPYHLLGLRTPIRTEQVLYRSEDALRRPTTNVTTVIRPLTPPAKAQGTRLVSYQSFYDSNNPSDSPSATIAGGTGLGNKFVDIESLLFMPLLLAGYTINIPDTQGPNANLAAMPEYGFHTLNSLRAVTSPDAGLGLDGDTPIGLIGYSGGAIASEWAAELAASYAPEVADSIVGTAAGGVLVHPAHNIDYTSDALMWSGVLPAALVGISKAYDLDFTPYLSEYGKKAVARLDDKSILFALGQYPGLTWQKMMKPEYADPRSVAPYVDVANRLIMGTGGTPSSPIFLSAGNNGVLEGTFNYRKDVGDGDGIIVTGDVRALARQYCDAGVDVKYTEYGGLTHFTAMAVWLPQAYDYLMGRFAGKPAPNTCSKVKPGNSLAPLQHVPPAH